MRVAKLQDEKGRERFCEVLKTGAVQFDPRPGWLLLAIPPGGRPRKQELHWVHASDWRIAGDRQFRFADPAEQ